MKFLNIATIILITVFFGVAGYLLLHRPTLSSAPQVSILVNTQTQDSSINSTSVSNGETASWKIYQNEKYGFELKYPNRIFTAKELNSNFGTNVGGGILLQSSIFATDSSGMGGSDYKHFFSVEFFALEKNLFSSIRDGVYPPLFINAFPKGTIESFDPVANDGYIKRFNLNGQEGFTFTSSSADGRTTEYSYVGINTEKTISITFNYISDSLQPKITESQQKEIFNQIISTFKFIK